MLFQPHKVSIRVSFSNDKVSGKGKLFVLKNSYMSLLHI